VQTDSQLQKQIDPAKKSAKRYLVLKPHGSEACNRRVQRVFFSRQEKRYEKKASSTQGMLD